MSTETLSPTELRDALERLNRKGRNKYGARREVVDGITFDSRAEAKRYGELRMLERIGEIHSLEVHPQFPLYLHGILLCTYVGDFQYLDRKNHVWVEDVKSPATRTAAYKIKARLFRALYGIQVTEVGA